MQVRYNIQEEHIYHVVRLPMSFKQGELKVSRHMYVEWSTRFVFK
jgi:hypothetical protein